MWVRAGGIYLLFLHVRHCVVVACSWLLGLYGRSTLFSHKSCSLCLYWPFSIVGFLLVMVVAGALFNGVVDTGVGRVARWVDVEVVVKVVVVRGGGRKISTDLLPVVRFH